MPRFHVSMRWKLGRGFTLIELLVVIAIIAIIIGLLLPAVQKVREAANRMKCTNNLKQYALACHHYHDNNGYFPPGGKNIPDWSWQTGDKGSWQVYLLPYMEQDNIYDQWSDIPRRYSLPFPPPPNTPPPPYFIPPNPLANQGMNSIPNWDAIGGTCDGNPADATNLQGTYDCLKNRLGFPGPPSSGGTGWVIKKLPYLRCPSDGFSPDTPYTNYVGSMGPQCAVGPCNYNPFQQFCHPHLSGLDKDSKGNIIPWGYEDAGENWNHGNTLDPQYLQGCFNRVGAKVNMAAVEDGLSNTILIGECLPAEHDHMQWGSVDMYWADFNAGNAHCTTIIPINYRSDEISGCPGGDPTKSFNNWNVSWGFKSHHTGGANFALGDGSVHFISENIDMKTYCLLGCRKDHQNFPVQPF
jgi:prepilin-type N-terminal cleavage/methylation domain-containing protein